MKNQKIDLSSFPLSDWRQAVVHPVIPRATQYVARRYCLKLHLASTVASLAGLGDSEERR
jgi:hypothetical protein